MNTINKWIVAVDLESNESYEKNGIKFYVPKHDGDELRDNPHCGILKHAPKDSKIPIGSMVYLTSYASEEHIEIEGELCYIVTENKLIAYGELDNMIPYKTILIEPIKENTVTSDLIYIPRINEVLPTTAKVIASDIDYVKAGDVIEYEERIDFEFFVNAKTYYYIDSSFDNRIVKVNGELVNNWEEVETPEEYIEKNNLRIKNTEKNPLISTGEYKGYRVVLDRGYKLMRNKYINTNQIAAIYE